MFRTSYITRSHSPSLCLDKDSKSGKRGKKLFSKKKKEKATGMLQVCPLCPLRHKEVRGCLTRSGHLTWLGEHVWFSLMSPELAVETTK